MRKIGFLSKFILCLTGAALLGLCRQPVRAAQADPIPEIGAAIPGEAEAGTAEPLGPGAVIPVEAAGTAEPLGPGAAIPVEAAGTAEPSTAGTVIPGEPEDEGAFCVPREAREALGELLSRHTVMALVYLRDLYPVREEPSQDSRTVVQVPSGQQVRIRDAAFSKEGELWVYVSFTSQDTEYEGYVQRANLACSDERYLDWEETCGIYLPASVMAAEADQMWADIEQFPESYRSALTALKNAHPNWTFVKMNTGLDWNTAAANEVISARSLVPASFASYMQEGSFSKSWSYASEEILKYYLDPRNGLTESGIFQFEQLTYNESYHREEAVQSFLDNTFMKGNMPGTELSYARAFWTVGRELGVSPFHLASRVYQEQGQGTSPLISGSYAGYEGYYNYFNVGASGKTDKEVIEKGLAYARSEGWSDPLAAIRGGARVISANYILKGQDTLYLQKFDVDAGSNGLYYHQYMQNICAPSSEASNIRRLYEKAGSLDNTFVFKIPVYDNMPGSACPKPTSSQNVVIKIPEGYKDARVYLDGRAYPAVSRNGQYIVTAPDGKASTAVLYQYDASGVPIGMKAWLLSYSGSDYSETELTGLRDLMTYHGFSIRITGRSGIRFKTGISLDLKEKLTGGGVEGWKLKEYGTLVMNRANQDRYPMILGGEKVKSGRAYGQKENGETEDVVFETVEDRLRYTLVLVDLPASQYKTEFAFRGYMILTKDGKEITLYGPPVARSIYSLAEQLLDMGAYPEESDAQGFLRQLIRDADYAG